MARPIIVTRISFGFCDDSLGQSAIDTRTKNLAEEVAGNLYYGVAPVKLCL